MPRALLNGIDTYYEVQGEGTPLLFIHGGYGGPFTSLIQLAETAEMPGNFFADRHRTITYDRRSAGRSEYITTEYTNEDLVADAAALLDHLDVDAAVVIGTSAGGPIAIQFALNWPERVIALGLPNTGAALMSLAPYPEDDERIAALNERLTLVRERIAPLERGYIEGHRTVFESRKEILRAPPTEETIATQLRPQLWELTEALRTVSDDDLFMYSMGQLRNMGASFGINLTERLDELTMPVIIVHGNADELVPFQFGLDLASRIPHAEFHAIDDAGHGITNHPEARQILRDWAQRMAD